MILESARESDWELIRRLSVQIHDLHAAWRPDIYYHCEEPYPKDAFLADIHENLVYVARDGVTVLGYVVLYMIKKGGAGTADKTFIRLESICVDEAYRGQGIGMEMVRQVRQIAKSFGCDGLILGVHPENEQAIAFYEKCGFTVRTINLELNI